VHQLGEAEVPAVELQCGLDVVDDGADGHEAMRASWTR
jgi:hypothetical protein